MTRKDPSRGASEIVVFGRHPVEAALRSDGAEVLSLAVLRSLPTAEEKHWRAAARSAGVELERCTRETLSRLTHAPRHDQGVAAEVRLRRLSEVDGLLAGATGRGARRPIRLLALDGVTNSQNVGMVVRSIVAAGLDGLLWPTTGQPWVNGLVVRAASGAIFECPIVRCETLSLGLGRLQGAGFRVHGLDAAADRSLFEVEPGHRSVFVLGNESLGLSDEVRVLVDVPVSIPMAGRIESLNVAVAAGLVCYQAGGLLGAPSAADPGATHPEETRGRP